MENLIIGYAAFLVMLLGGTDGRHGTEIGPGTHLTTTTVHPIYDSSKPGGGREYVIQNVKISNYAFRK